MPDEEYHLGDDLEISKDLFRSRKREESKIENLEIEYLVNRVCKTMATAHDPSVHLYGWLRGDTNRLTNDLGQPEGPSLMEMMLGPMKHCIIVPIENYKTFKILIDVPAGAHDYVFLLNMKRIIFVARYTSDAFRIILESDLAEQMKDLAALMEAQIKELDGKDDVELMEGAEFVLYHPKKKLSRTPPLEQNHDFGPMMEAFEKTPFILKFYMFSKELLNRLIIETNDKGELAKHNLFF